MKLETKTLVVEIRCPPNNPQDKIHHKFIEISSILSFPGTSNNKFNVVNIKQQNSYNTIKGSDLNFNYATKFKRKFIQIPSTSLNQGSRTTTNHWNEQLTAMNHLRNSTNLTQVHPVSKHFETPKAKKKQAIQCNEHQNINLSFKNRDGSDL